MGVLIGSYLIYRRIVRQGAPDTLTTKNGLASWLYFAYLGLGFVSFLWSTNVGFSALQWFMTMQSLVFCYFFVKSIALLNIYFPNNTTKLYNLLGNTVFILILI